MTKQYLVLARHGESEANANLASSSCGLYYSNSGSDPAVPLTDRGLSQGAQVAQQLALRFPPERKIVRVFHNQFERVRQFAAAVTSGLGYDVEQICDARLNKRSYGMFWNLTYEGVQSLHPEEWERFCQDGPLLYRPPQGGENYPDVFARVEEFFAQEIMPARENLLVITSSVVVLSFMRFLENLEDEEVVRQYEAQAVPNAHLIVYCRSAGSDSWRRCSDK